VTTVQAINVGQRVGPYRIDGVLGAGGMGVVYLAQDCELRRTVAIKVVDRSRHHPNAMRLLLQEARVAASLNHPSICSVHEVGRFGDEPYIVMEHVEGTLLSDVIPRDTGLPIERAIHYEMQIVDAIAHAHRHGIVHGDLKTSNIMVGSDGRVKVLDFGLAVQKVSEIDLSDGDTTRPPELDSGAGTVPYMAPELLRGRRAQAPSDIWALGVVLFEMLVGYRPFRGGTAYELAAAILADQPLPLPPRVPGALRGVVSRCLSKHPIDRFATVRDLAAALEDVE
jgi:serine/threonine protein kinase